jgi:hypothetical protein
MILEDVVVNTVYIVNPNLGVDKFLPTVRVLNNSKFFLIVLLANGEQQAMSAYWLVAPSTPLMEALF